MRFLLKTATSTKLAMSCALRNCLGSGRPSTSFATARQIFTAAQLRAEPKALGKLAHFTKTKINASKAEAIVQGAFTAQQSLLTDLVRLMKLAWPYWRRYAMAFSCLIASSGIFLAFPRVLAYLLDEPSKAVGTAVQPVASAESSMNSVSEGAGHQLGQRTINYVMQHLWLVPILLSVGAFSIGARLYLMHTTGQLIINDLRKKVFRSLVNQDMAFYDKNKVGEIVSRLGSDALVVGNSVSQNLSDGASALVRVVGSASMMYITSPHLTLAGVGLAPWLCVMYVVLSKLLNAYSKQMQMAIAKSNQHATERFANVRTVKSLVSEEREISSYDRIMHTVWEVAKREGMAIAVVHGTLQLTLFGTLTILLYRGSGLIEQGLLTYGDLSAFCMYFFMGFGGFSTMANFLGGLMKGLGASTRLFEMAESVPSIPRTGGLQIDAVRKGIRFESVGFVYPSRQRLFTDLSFTIPAGKVTAVVGPSGCGKSTVASLILRLYDPEDGRILIDDEDLRRLDPSHWRSMIGTVGQDPVLFTTTIRENICYGAKESANITEDMVVEAARLANCLEFIRQLPGGFDTVVGEHGASNLSGGQRQRIAIARALINKPKILVLDEATSAQDATSEYLVRNALNTLLADKTHTVLIIAHRLSTIKHADQIVVLDRGMVAELGTFDELMVIPNGVFKALVEKQMEGWSGDQF